jgi:hypothetical protein
MTVENADEMVKTARELAESIGEQKISTLDFDRLRECLLGVPELVEAAAAARAELAVLREDYTGRIAGLMKAVAVARRSRDGLQEALDRIEALPGLTAVELTREYRRAAARFRDTFKASYGLLTAPRGSRRAEDYASFK